MDNNANQQANVASGVEMIDTSIKFRDLTPKEIECRAQIDKYNRMLVRIMLYKDSRVDMNILDETVGNGGWERLHQEIKGVLYCGVGIRMRDGTVKWKWDCGTESNTEAQKGEASDAFKRACFCWGIGRKLYTTPTIVFSLFNSDTSNGKLCRSFSVKEIEYSNSKISYLLIVDDCGFKRFSYGIKGRASGLKGTARQSAIKRLAEGEDLWPNLREVYSFDEAALRQELQAYIESGKKNA